MKDVKDTYLSSFNAGRVYIYPCILRYGIIMGSWRLVFIEKADVSNYFGHSSYPYTQRGFSAPYTEFCRSYSYKSISITIYV